MGKRKIKKENKELRAIILSQRKQILHLIRIQQDVRTITSTSIKEQEKKNLIESVIHNSFVELELIIINNL